jgi:hypothetical protein
MVVQWPWLFLSSVYDFESRRKPTVRVRFWDAVHHAVDRIPLKIIRQNFEKDRLTVSWPETTFCSLDFCAKNIIA